MLRFHFRIPTCYLNRLYRVLGRRGRSTMGYSNKLINTLERTRKKPIKESIFGLTTMVNACKVETKMILDELMKDAILASIKLRDVIIQ